MYAIPRALLQYRGVTFEGKVVYPDHEDYVPSKAIDDTFIGNLSNLIQKIASPNPSRRVASGMECSFCNITAADCPERIEVTDVGVGDTEDF
jgi:hypothetical protein